MADQKLTDLTEVSVPALDDLLYTVDVSDTSGGAAGTSKKLTQTRQLGLLNQVCEGRLTLTSGTPVTTTDVTAATSVYFTPFNGNQVALYDGTRWRMCAFTELTLALGTLTSGKNYDVFLYDNSGTLTLESLVWTNDTTRATALTTQDGVYVKTGATTRRYLGTFRTTSTTTTEDSAGGTTTKVGGKRFLWNMYNRVVRPIQVADTTATWTYSTASNRIADGASSPNNCVEMVSGLALSPITLDIAVVVTSSTGPIGVRVFIGEDSGTTAATGGFNASSYPSGASMYGMATARLTKIVPVGYHYYSYLEQGGGSGTQTWSGYNGSDWCGMSGWWES